MMGYKKKFWKPSEIEYLTAHFSDTKTQEIADYLGRNYSVVSQKAASLGLKKSEEFMIKHSNRITNSSVGRNTQFKKRATPWNKGTHFFNGGSSFFFKKGNIPHNVKHNGHLRVVPDGYQEIRLDTGEFKRLHVKVWEDANGPIPEGYIVVFRDKDKNNCSLENLELITRAENMRRNTIHRYPEELKSTIRVLGKLKRKINEK